MKKRTNKTARSLALAAIAVAIAAFAPAAQAAVQLDPIDWQPLPDDLLQKVTPANLKVEVHNESGLQLDRQSRYKIKVTNTGDFVAKPAPDSIAVGDALPKELEIISAYGDGFSCTTFRRGEWLADRALFACSLDADQQLAPKESREITVAVRALDLGSVTVSATALWNRDPVAADNTGSDGPRSIQIVPTGDDLQLSDPINVIPPTQVGGAWQRYIRAGEQGYAALHIINGGAVPLDREVVVTAKLGEGVRYTGDDAANAAYRNLNMCKSVPSVSGGTRVQCKVNFSSTPSSSRQVSTLAPDGLELIAFPIEVTGAARDRVTIDYSIGYVGSISPGTDSNTLNNQVVRTSDVRPDLVASLDGAKSIKVGGEADLDVRVKNASDIPTNQAEPSDVSLQLPAGVKFVSSDTVTSITGTRWTCAGSGQVVNCRTNDALAARRFASTIKVRVAASAAAYKAAGPGNKLAFTATPAHRLDLLNSSSNGTRALALEAVDQTPAISGATDLEAGSSSDYSVDLKSIGGATLAAAATKVQLNAPQGTELSEVGGSSWKCEHNASTANCTSTTALSGGFPTAPSALGVKLSGRSEGSGNLTAKVTNGEDADTTNDSSAFGVRVFKRPTPIEPRPPVVEPQSTPVATVASSRATSIRGRAIVVVRCTGSTGKRCTGALSARGKAGSRTVTLRGSYSVAAGSSSKVTLKLSRATRKNVKRAKSVLLKVTLTSTGASSARSGSRVRLTVKS